MEQEGYVSLWVGNFSSKQDFENYLHIAYDEDGGALLSIFQPDFEIEYYDLDFREVEFFDNPISSIQELLRGCSYDETIIPKFRSMIGEAVHSHVNSMMLLYNFKYEGQPSSQAMTYLGAVTYK